MVNGECAPRFARVRDEFERNFAERGETGASVCVMVDGEPVVDLWGGEAGERPWARDTVSVVFSTTKGVTALCAHILASRGQLDFAAPVAATGRSSALPVRMTSPSAWCSATAPGCR